jgi:hypothetical protein
MDDQFVPRQGENNIEILAELGFSREDIAEMARTGAIVASAAAATAEGPGES